MKHSTQAVQLILSITVVSLILGYLSKDIKLNQKESEVDNLKAELRQTISLYNNLAIKYNQEIIVEEQSDVYTEDMVEENNNTEASQDSMTE